MSNIKCNYYLTPEEIEFTHDESLDYHLQTERKRYYTEEQQKKEYRFNFKRHNREPWDKHGELK